MDYKIEHLNAENYDELLHMLNTVFHKSEGDTFDIFLPVMWKRDDEHMSKHLAIREHGKLAAVVGVYPLPAIISGELLPENLDAQTKLYIQSVLPLPLWWCNQDRV